MLSIIAKSFVAAFIAVIFYGVAAAVYDKIIGVAETSLTLDEPLAVWFFGFAGLVLGYKYVLKIIAAFVDNLGLM